MATLARSRCGPFRARERSRFHAPAIPDEHYLWLGRVTSAYGMLDVQIGMLGYAAQTGITWTEDWTQVAGRPGMAFQLCKHHLHLMPDTLASRAASLLDATEPLRQERHRLSHAVFILDPETQEESSPWLLKDPKGGETALLSASTGADLVRALNRLSREAGEIRAALKAIRPKSPSTVAPPSESSSP